MNIEQVFLEKHQKDEKGIFIPVNSADVSTKFSAETQNSLLKIEDTSWWFKYRAEVIENVAEMFFDKGVGVFDVGGGNGYTTFSMQRHGWKTCLVEPSYQACANGKCRGIENVVCNTVSEKSVKDGSLRQVLLLDVLEHIQDDAGFLNILNAKLMMRGGGYALITVPAFKSLWSSEDDSAGHFRRYTKKSLESVAKAAGFEVLYLSYFFGFLYIPIFLVRHLGEKIGILKRTDERSEQEREKIASQQFKEKKGVVDFVLRAFERHELKRLLKRRQIGFGSSVICVMRKLN